MEIDYLWWSVQFILNFLDFAMIYVIIHAFLKQHIKIKLSHIILGVLFTIVLAPVFYFWNSYLFRIVSMIFMLLIIRVVSKRRNLGDLIVMLALFTAIVVVVQTPVVVLLWLLRKIIGFSEPLTFLLTQMTTAILILLVSRKVKLNQLFNALIRNVVLKLIVVILALIALAINAILNFDDQLLHGFFFAMSIIFIGLALFPIFVQLYHNTIGIISVHDLKNSLLSTGLAIEDEADIDVVKNKFRELAKQYGMDLSQLNSKKFDDQLNCTEVMTKKVKDFIRIKLDSTDKEIKVISNITYSSDYKSVNFEIFLKWLGTMLDNALEASHQHPIYIHIGVTIYGLVLRMANEYVGHEGKDIQVIFEKGYTTKGEDKGRGIGLHNLHKEVEKRGGKIMLDEYYTAGHNCHYLQISILFSTDD